MRLLIKNNKFAAMLFLLLIGSVFVFASWSRLGLKASNASPDPSKETRKESAMEAALASPGRVEGSSEVINVGAGADGVIAELRVREGQQVRAGDILAVIDRRDLNAELSAARAEAESVRQARARLVRGSRDEERQQAQAEASA